MTLFKTSSFFRTAFVAFAALGAMTAIGTQAAEARRFHHGLSIHVGDGIGVGFHHRHHRHHSRVVLVPGGPRCGYLRHQAVRTGSAYWWDRYNDCRYGG